MKKYYLLLTILISVCTTSNGQEHALYFYDNGERVELGPHSNFGIGDVFTIEAWIKFSEHQPHTIISAYDTDGSDHPAGWWFGTTDDGRPYWWIANPDSSEDYSLIGTSDISDFNPHHLSAVFNNGVAKLYHNGILEGEMTVDNWDFDVQSNVLIGQDNDGAGSFAVIDDIRIWDFDRPPPDIQTYWASPCIDGTEGGLIASYQFQEGSGNGISDLGPNNLSGILVNDSANWFFGHECETFTMSVNEMELAQIEIYPNPATELTRIDFDRNISGFLRVIDMNGRSVHSGILTNESYCLLNMTLPSGMYKVQIFDESSSSSASFTVR